MPLKKRYLATVPKGGEWDPLTPAQRKRVEEAYGQGPLSEVVWTKIQLATALYNSGAAVERAVPMDEFLGKLEKLRAAAREVNRYLPEMSHRVYTTIDPQLTSIERQMAIQEKYFELHEFGPTPIFPINVYELLSHTLAAVADVALFTAMEFNDPEVGYTQGWMWDYWLHLLTVITREHGLPYSARKDSDKQTGEISQISPFVLLVKELQNHLSAETKLTIGKREPDALAGAISRARRGKDIEVKFTDVVDLELFGNAAEWRGRLGE
jgi:hypothetical protein